MKFVLGSLIWITYFSQTSFFKSFLIYDVRVVNILLFVFLLLLFVETVVVVSVVLLFSLFLLINFCPSPISSLIVLFSKKQAACSAFWAVIYSSVLYSFSLCFNRQLSHVHILLLFLCLMLLLLLLFSIVRDSCNMCDAANSTWLAVQLLMSPEWLIWCDPYSHLYQQDHNSF